MNTIGLLICFAASSHSYIIDEATSHNLEAVSLSSPFHHLWERISYVNESLSFCAFVKSVESNNRTIFTLRDSKNGTVKIVHDGPAIVMRGDILKRQDKFLYESGKFALMCVRLAEEKPGPSDDSTRTGVTEMLGVKNPFEESEDLDLFIGDPSSEGVSFNGTVAGLLITEAETEYFKRYSKFNCLKEDPMKLKDARVHFENLKDWNRFGNASFNNESFFDLCESYYDVLPINRKGLMEIPSRVCGKHNGRNFTWYEIINYQERLIPIVETACNGTKNSSITIWKDECTVFNLRDIDSDDLKTCSPTSAYFLCILKKSTNYQFYETVLDYYLFKKGFLYAVFGKIPFKPVKDEASGDFLHRISSDDNKTTISFSDNRWTLESTEFDDKWFMNDSLLPFGLHKWHSYAHEHSQDVMLAACGEHQLQYPCGNGECIEERYFCDGINHCEDGSDERCPLFFHLFKHNNEQIPSENGTRIKVEYNIKITGFGEVKAANDLLAINLELSVKWFDYRAYFRETARGKIYDCNELFWHPKFQFATGCGTGLRVNHTIHETTCQTLLSKKDPQKEIKRFSDGFYDGKNAMLVQDMSFHLDLPCLFDFKFFPFSAQRCQLCFWIRKTNESLYEFTSASRDGVVDAPGISSIGDFTLDVPIHNVMACSKVMVTIPMHMPASFYVLTGYVPTILILIVSYATLYFRLDLFSDRVSVSLTALLAMVFLFVETTGNATRTSYIKLFDIWFLAVMSLSVALVCFNCLLHFIANLKETKRLKMTKKIMIEENKEETNSLYAESKLLKGTPHCEVETINFVGKIGFPILLLIFSIVYATAAYYMNP